MSNQLHHNPAVTEFAEIQRYWNDPAYAAKCHVERIIEQRRMDNLFAAHTAAWRAKQAERWAREGDA